ncbi:MAG: XrtA-associated tyrosine autokinase [Syntrophotaleaceae bacterium]
MSRIEKAIEKATLLRKNGSEAEKEHTAPSPVLEMPVSPAMALRAHGEPPEVKPLAPKNPLLVINHESGSGTAEEYRKLKSIIIELTRQNTFKNTLLITSPLPAAGKTITSLNLALTMAREYDHTVLLVDADLRKPSVHKYFGISPEKGLVQCLTEGCPLETALIRTGIGKLVLLPAGGTVDDPAELLGSNRMRNLVAELKSRYPDRYVIFDTTPVLPFAEASTLGHLMDGILMIVRERKTRPSELKQALELIKSDNLLGLVYNDTDTSQKIGYYGYQY